MRREFSLVRSGIRTASVFFALVLFATSPAQAHHRYKDSGTGDLIVGALIVGGIAALLSRNGQSYSFNDDNGYRSRRAVRKCVRAVRRDARRAGYGSAEITRIFEVFREPNGWRVRGGLSVNEGRDSGRFKCDLYGGRVGAVDYRGLRYLS